MNMTVGLFGLLTLAGLLSGCSSIEEQRIAFESRERVVKAQIGMEQEKIAEASCGTVEKPCHNFKLTIYRERNKIITPKVRTANDVIVESLPMASHITGAVVGGISEVRTMKYLAEGFGGGNTNTSNTNVLTGDDNSFTANPTLNMNKTDSVVGDSSSESSSTSVSSSSTSTTDSNDTIDNSSTVEDHSNRSTSVDDHSVITNDRHDDNSVINTTEVINEIPEDI